jgi:heme oxygenase
MENLIIDIAITFFIIAFITIVWLFKSINSKEHIEKYMSKKYGKDWLDQITKNNITK